MMQEMDREATTFFVQQMGTMVEDHQSTESGSSEGDQTSTCVLNPGNATSACETSMWEEWTQGTSTGVDEVSTSNFLPELTSSTTSRLSFQQSDMLATWMSTFHPLAPSYLSPVDLTPSTSVVDVATNFMHEPGLAGNPSDLETVDAVAHAFPLAYENSKAATGGASALRKMRRAAALGPLSPSSPLAVQNGLLNPLGDPWDNCPSTLQWSTVTTTGQTDHDNSNFGHSATGSTTTTATATTATPATFTSFIPDHSSAAIDHLESMTTATRFSPLSRPRHTDIYIGPNGTFESSTPGGWTPQLMYDAAGVGSTVESSATPIKLMVSLLEAGETASSDVGAESKLNGLAEIGLNPRDHADRVRQLGISEPSSRQGCSAVSMSSMLADCNRSGADSSGLMAQVVWPGKHRLELVELVDGEEEVKSSSLPLLKRPRTTPSVEHTNALQWSDQTLRGAELRSYCSGGISSSSLAASHAMEIIAIGPALNTNGKPRARRGSATDPQSVYARHRREKINERLKNLQNLVPNGAKVDIVTMLDEAIHYVKFLQNQVEFLKSDDYWMYATPNNYNGMDLQSKMCPQSQSQELESSAS